MPLLPLVPRKGLFHYAFPNIAVSQETRSKASRHIQGQKLKAGHERPGIVDKRPCFFKRFGILGIVAEGENR